MLDRLEMAESTLFYYYSDLQVPEPAVHLATCTQVHTVL